MLYPNTQQRPADIAARNWVLSAGKPITAFDVTVTSPLKTDCVTATIVDPTRCLNSAHQAKFNDYRDIPEHIDLVPLVVTTFGAWHSQAELTFKELAKQQATNSPRSSASQDRGRTKKHLMQRLSVCLQRENAEAVLARSPLSAAPAYVDGIL